MIGFQNKGSITIMNYLKKDKGIYQLKLFYKIIYLCIFIAILLDTIRKVYYKINGHGNFLSSMILIELIFGILIFIFLTFMNVETKNKGVYIFGGKIFEIDKINRIELTDFFDSLMIFYDDKKILFPVFWFERPKNIILYIAENLSTDKKNIFSAKLFEIIGERNQVGTNNAVIGAQRRKEFVYIVKNLIINKFLISSLILSLCLTFIVLIGKFNLIKLLIYFPIIWIFVIFVFIVCTLFVKPSLFDD
jgi:hypothetical protein